MAKKIIDVSVHNGSIDWSKAKSQIDGAIIRIGYGDDVIGQDDSKAVYNMDECEKYGIPYHVYLYSYANSDAHIKSEVAHMQRMIVGRHPGKVWLDLEERNYKAWWRKATTVWMAAFPDTGGVYSWAWCFTDVLDGIDCPRWICAYGTNNGYPQYGYKPVIDCDGWQYTSKAHISGINGAVDASEWYADFSESTPTTAPTTSETAPTTANGKTYEVSKTGTPNKTTIIKWGLLKNHQKVTPRMQPDESAEPTGFSPVQPLTRIDVCDYITTTKRWAYCRVNGLYGFILASSIRDYLRIPNQSNEKVAEWVLNDDFGSNDVRKNALEILGYDYDAVQKIVTAKVEAEAAKNPKFRIWPIWFFEKDEALFGDCTALIEYAADGSVAHCILIDTAQADASAVVVSKLKAAGVNKIDAVVLSHAHGDHYGGLIPIMAKIPVGAIFAPDTTELAKYQASCASKLKYQVNKVGSHKYLKAGDSFQVGNIYCDCLYICPADKLSEHGDHYFVNNESAVLRFTLGDWTYHTAGDLQNEGNNLLIKAVSNLHADIFKCQWHGDANACNEAICQAIKPLIAISDYHHAEAKGGRQTTRKRLEAVGAVVARNSENGDIYIDIQGQTAKLSCSKGNLSQTFVKKN